MYKPLRYKTLADLIVEFVESYASCCHVVKKVKLSYPLVHGAKSNDDKSVAWNYFVLPVDNLSKDAIKKNLLDYSREFRDHVFALKKQKDEANG